MLIVIGLGCFAWIGLSALIEYKSKIPVKFHTLALSIRTDTPNDLLNIRKDIQNLRSVKFVSWDKHVDVNQILIIVDITDAYSIFKRDVENISYVVEVQRVPLGLVQLFMKEKEQNAVPDIKQKLNIGVGT